MRRPLLFLALLIFVGGIAFFVSRGFVHPKTPGMSHSSVALVERLPGLAWLESELSLTPEQVTEITALHNAYVPHCMEMCERIIEAEARLESAALDARGMTDELEQALAHRAQVHQECQGRMLEHLYETAALMNESQAKRYFEIVLPAALTTSHPALPRE